LALAIQTILERSRLFRSLPAPALQQITALAIRRSYRNGASVFSQGDPGDALYGVASGRIRISASGPDGREIFLNIMEPGDSFGEIALLDGAPRTASATASAPSELFIIKREPFLLLLQRDAKVTYQLLQLLCQRIRWTSGLAEDSALLSTPARLARRLLSLARVQGQSTAPGARLVMSQEEIARFLGLSRQMVNQYLQRWKSVGWVELGRGQITLLQVDALERVAAGSE
jgi:CRP/FNR family transcriptional regulator, cyclic AMP receptor protein